jgi:hypothetical protein
MIRLARLRRIGLGARKDLGDFSVNAAIPIIGKISPRRSRPWAEPRLRIRIKRVAGEAILISAHRIKLATLTGCCLLGNLPKFWADLRKPAANANGRDLCRKTRGVKLDRDAAKCRRPGCRLKTRGG